VHWNGDQSYYEAVVDAVLQAPASGGLNADLTIGFMLANEVWNPGFGVFYQARLEADALQLDGIEQTPWSLLPVNSAGTRVGAGEGYCYRFVQVMQWIKARWNAHARTDKPTIKCIFEWQNSGGGWAATLLDYIPKGAAAPSLGDVTVKSVATDYWVAPYAATGPDDSQSAPTTVDEAFTQLYAQIPGVFNTAASARDAALARGLGFGCYEGGTHPNFNNDTLQTALAHDARMYDFITYYFQQYLSVVGSHPFTYYSNHGRRRWAALDYTYQTPTLANAPKHMALKALAAA
jgi:hypothetical protein